VNIAGSAKRLAAEPPLKPLVDIPRMADLASTMLHQGLDAFVSRDSATARELVKRDDEVDALNHQMFRELLSFMIEDPRTITRAMELILVARNLERSRTWRPYRRRGGVHRRGANQSITSMRP
jgi:phosphate transport system protein